MLLAGAADLSESVSRLGRQHSNALQSGSSGLGSARALRGRRAFSGSSLGQPGRQGRHTIIAEAARQNKDAPLRDPETRFRRYGRDFGGNYLMSFVEGVTQMRGHPADERQKDQLADLAVVNERLAGTSQPWSARQRLEYLRQRRQQWEGVYEYLIKTDAAATLASIEDAHRKVSAALSEEAQETQSVGELKQQLTMLQAEVETASQRLALTKARVSQNMQRVDQLKAEAAQLERMKTRADQEEQAAADQVAAAAAVAASAAPVTGAVPSAAEAPAAAAASPAVGMATLEPAAAPQVQRQQRKSRPQSRFLYSSLELEPGLRNHWYPAHFSSQLTEDKLIPFELFGEAWVLFRDGSGQPACVQDQCAHRACPLSLGSVVDGNIQCPYHGWEYNTGGECVKMPSTNMCPGVTVTSLPCSERDGLVWVWPGEGPVPEVPTFSRPPDGYTVHAEIEVEVPVEHGLLMENLLDLAHAPFTHTSTFAKGWPIPDAVKFRAMEMLGGAWEPYPIDMSFVPPCMVLSTIGLAQPGKIQRGQRAAACQNHLHQLHICLPSKRGSTRLLYRMSLDFMNWTRFVPGIQKFWVHIAGQVLGEDLVLVSGQQDRMQRGADTWAHPVSYDKLAVRYRRWRNSIPDAAPVSAASQQQSQLVSMSAGELFSEADSDFEDDDDEPIVV